MAIIKRKPERTVDNIKLRDAAKKIYGKSAPTWFVSLLTEQAAYLKPYSEGSSNQPGLGAMRERLEDSERFASRLATELEDPFFATTATLGKTNLNYIRLAAELRLLSKSMVDAKDLLPKTRGPGAAPMIYDGVLLTPRNPKTLCAIIVVSAWRAVRQTEPKHNSTGPQDAAAKLWDSAGLEATGNWRDHLFAAKKIKETETEAGFLAPYYMSQWASLAVQQGLSPTAS